MNIKTESEKTTKEYIAWLENNPFDTTDIFAMVKFINKMQIFFEEIITKSYNQGLKEGKNTFCNN